MEKNIELLTIISLFIIGLSHIFQPKVWADFFKLLIRHGTVGVFINALMTLPLGVLIVAFHNVWHGGQLIVTLIGWAYLLKVSISFLYPAIGLRSMKRIEKNSIRDGRLAGAFHVLLVIAIFFFAYLPNPQ